MKDELISREAAIEEIEYWHGIDVSEILERLPSVGAPRWILVSESLPKDGQGCLITQKGYIKRIIRISTFAKDLYDVDEYDFRDKKGVSGWFRLDSEYGFCEDCDVIAWMPLPKPFKGESDEHV